MAATRRRELGVVLTSFRVLAICEGFVGRIWGGNSRGVVEAAGWLVGGLASWRVSDGDHGFPPIRKEREWMGHGGVDEIGVIPGLKSETWGNRIVERLASFVLSVDQGADEIGGGAATGA
jgi:hypothetical protein